MNNHGFRPRIQYYLMDGGKGTNMISAEKYEYLFDKTVNPADNFLAQLQHKDVYCYRSRVIESGTMLEAEVYPKWSKTRQIRCAKSKQTRLAQQQLNAKNARKRFARLVNTNFGSNDICISLTYADDTLPTIEQSRRDVRNYLRRIRTYRRKNGYSEIKYIYVTEIGAQNGRIHHHIIMSGMDRDIAEAMWPYGRRNSKRLQLDDYGLMDISFYVLKSRAGQKRWTASRNLVEPKVSVSDTMLSTRDIEALAQGFEESPSIILCGIFPNYTLNICDVKRSDIVAGVYVYAVMHRTPEVPKIIRRKCKVD